MLHRPKERFEQKQLEYQGKLGKREAKAKESGHKPRGRSPAPPVDGAQDKDQINLTDEESRIMKTADGGFNQCYNGQIVVDMDSMLIVTADTVQACNDKPQIELTLEQLKRCWARRTVWWRIRATSPRPTSIFVVSSKSPR